MLEVIRREPGVGAPATEKKPWISEDWLAVWIGLSIFGLAVAGLYGQDFSDGPSRHQSGRTSIRR